MMDVEELWIVAAVGIGHGSQGKPAILKGNVFRAVTVVVLMEHENV